MKNKFYMRIFASILLLIVFASALPLAVFANSIIPPGDIDKTNVLEDLLKMEAYSKDRYPVDESAEYCDIVDFIEYGYDYSGRTNDYGLYLYLYNPSCREINVSSRTKNKIQIRVAPADETVAGGDTAWEKYGLIYLSKSGDNLFYKFKLDISKSYMRNPDKTQRIYEIADIEIFYTGETMAKSVGCSGKWMYTGYQEYHGSNINSSYSDIWWDSDNLMTVELEINQATWKSDTSAKGQGWQNEMFSAYFSVPNSIIRDYGDTSDPTKGLVEINGYYNNLKLRGLSVSDSTLYSSLYEYRNKVASDSVPYGFYTEIYDNDSLMGTTNLFLSFYGYNRSKFPLQFGNIFCVNLSTFGDVYQGTMFGITEESFREQITERYNSGNLIGTVGSDSAHYYTVKSDGEDMALQIGTMSDAKGSYDFWDWLDGIPVYNDEHYEGIKPIVIVDPLEVGALNTKAVSEKYYVCEEDAAALEEYMSGLNDVSKTTYLMRFAVRDYFNEDIYLCREGGASSGGADIATGNGNYYFEKEVFMDFDILSLTWKNKNGVRKVIPVKASPIHIVGSVSTTPALDDDDKKDDDKTGCSKLMDLETGWIVFAVLSVVIGFVALAIIFPPFGKLIGALFNGLIWILALPFKLIAWLVDKVFLPESEAKRTYKYDSKLKKDASEYEEKRSVAAHEREVAEKKRQEKRAEKAKKKDKKKTKKEGNKSYDLDEFFEASLKNSEKEMDNFLNNKKGE